MKPVARETVSLLPMKILRSLALVVVAAITFVAIVLVRAHSPGAPAYAPSAQTRAMQLARLRTWEEHDEAIRRIGKPYVVELNGGRGALLAYGSRHTQDPRDPQMADIERRWNEFRPTVALYEGRQRSFFDTPLLDPIKGKSEAEQLHQLASHDGVKIYTLEPDYAGEVAMLLRKWTSEQVALFFFTRVYWGEAQGRVDESLANDLLRKRTDVEGLRGSLKTLADVDRVWKRDFPGDWRAYKGEPPRDSYLATIADDSRAVRGEHMARTLIELTQRGERVFCVVGSGNIVRIEWALRSALGAPPAFDQKSS